MKKTVRAAILGAALTLGVGAYQPAYASNQPCVEEKGVFQKIGEFFMGTKCKDECPPCPETKTTPRRRTAKPSRSNLEVITKDQRPQAEYQGDFKIYCPGEATRFFAPEPTPAQKNAGYTLETFVAKDQPKLFRDAMKDNVLTSEEVKSLNEYGIATAKVGTVLKKNGVAKASHQWPVSFVYDANCGTSTFSQTNIIYFQPAAPAAPAVEPPSEEPRHETPRKERTPRRSEKIYEPNDAVVDVSVSGGIFTQALESTIIQETPKGTKTIPFEVSYTGTKIAGKIQRSTNNTDFRLTAATSSGTTTLDSYTAQFCDENVKGTSIGAEGTLGLFRNGWFHPGVFAGGEYKRVTFGNSTYFGNAVSMENTNNSGYGGVSLVFGRMNGSYLGLKAGGFMQDMTFARPYLASTNSARSDGITEKGLMGQVDAQVVSKDGHWQFYGNVRALRPETQSTTNEAERLASSDVVNYRVGLNYVINPKTEGSWYVGVRGEGAKEATTFTNGSTFDSNSTAFMLTIGHR